MKKMIALGLFLMTLTVFAQTHAIKFNLKKGDTYYAVTDLKMDMLQKAMGQEMPMKMNFLIGYSFKVMDAAEGGYAFEGKYNYIGSNVQVMGQDVKMASDLKDENPVNKMFAAMVNVPFTMKIKDNGEVLSVDGYEKILEGMKNALPETMREQMMQEFGKSFSKDQVAQSMKSTFFAIPPKPVKLGDTWEAVYTSNSNGVDLINKMNCKLESVEKEAYKISYTGDFSAKGNGTVEQNGMTMDVKKMLGSASGTVILDKKTSWVKNNDSQTKMNMLLEMKMGDQNMPVESTIDMKTVVTDVPLPTVTITK